jgi:NAD(P)-dependent dehydrogenase (short-subunit alcohol dehydrogenase family)
MLEGKVVVITGAESGIGRAVSLRCAEEGAHVALAGLVEEGLQETAKLAGEDAQTITVRTDIRDAEQVDALFAATVKEFGRLDAAFANAGGAMRTPSELVDSDLDLWKQMIETNLTGTFITLRAAARILIDQGEGGSLIATGSSTAIRPIATAPLAYMAGKAGVHQLMRALTLEMAQHNIRVNTLVPGGSATPPVLAIENYAEKNFGTVPMKSLVDPTELAAIVAFALSDQAPHMTGTLLKVDAGRTSV